MPKKYEGLWNSASLKPLMEQGKVYVECQNCGEHIESWLIIVGGKCTQCHKSHGIMEKIKEGNRTAELKSLRINMRHYASVIKTYLGHPIGTANFTVQRGFGVSPSLLTWHSTYSLQMLTLRRPRKGVVVENVVCDVCGKSVRIRIRSRLRVIQNWLLPLISFFVVEFYLFKEYTELPFWFLLLVIFPFLYLYFVLSYTPAVEIAEKHPGHVIISQKKAHIH